MFKDGEGEVQNAVLSLADGTSITTSGEGEPQVGESVTFTESGEAVPDAAHELSDGTVITTEGGIITEVATPEASIEEGAVTREEFTELQNELREQNASLQALLKDTQNSVKMLADHVVKAKATTTKPANIPTADSASKFKKTDVKAAKRSALEDYVNNKKK